MYAIRVRLVWGYSTTRGRTYGGLWCFEKTNMARIVNNFCCIRSTLIPGSISPHILLPHPLALGRYRSAAKMIVAIRVLIWLSEAKFANEKVLLCRVVWLCIYDLFSVLTQCWGNVNEKSKTKGSVKIDKLIPLIMRDSHRIRNDAVTITDVMSWRFIQIPQALIF